MRVISIAVAIMLIALVLNGCIAKQFTTISEPVPKLQGYHIDYDGHGMQKYQDIVNRYPGVKKAFDAYPYCNDRAAFSGVVPLSRNRRIRVGYRLTPSEQQLSGLIAGFSAGGPIGGLKFPTGNDYKGRFKEISINPIEDQSNYEKGYTLFVYDLDPTCDLYILNLSLLSDGGGLIFKQ